VLDNPAPIFRIDTFGGNGVEIILSIWFDRNFLLDAKTTMLMDIKKRYEHEDIEIPYEKIDVMIKETPAQNS
jgi:small-conductance mechanosensitive channel